eukprot:1152613-Pelagomonas_calceolata.AAC.7
MEIRLVWSGDYEVVSMEASLPLNMRPITDSCKPPIPEYSSYPNFLGKKSVDRVMHGHCIILFFRVLLSNAAVPSKSTYK